MAKEQNKDASKGKDDIKPGLGRQDFTVPVNKDWFNEIPTVGFIPEHEAKLAEEFNRELDVKQGQRLAEWLMKGEGIKEHGERVHAKFDANLKKQRMRYHKLRPFKDGLKTTWHRLLCKTFGHELNYDYTCLWCPRCQMALEEAYCMDGVNFYVAMNEVYRLSAINSSSQYVDYAMAVKLRNMGFAEACNAYYNAQDTNIQTDGFADNSENTRRIAAPTIQEAFTWLTNVNKNRKYVPVTGSTSWTTKCNSCGMTGVNGPDMYDCGNCGSKNTVTYRMEIKDNAEAIDK